MRSLPIVMGAMPHCWVGGCAHEILTSRFVRAAQRWAHSSCGAYELRLLRKKPFRRITRLEDDSSVRLPWGTIAIACVSSHCHQQIRSAYIVRSGDPFRSAYIVRSGDPFSPLKETRKLKNLSSRPHSSTKRGEESLRPGDSKYIDWWEEQMKHCQKPSTRELIKRLVPTNLFGLDPNLRNGSLKEGTLSRELLEIKRRFPYEVILARVGEFYECSGFDACVLVEYAGLNPMGGLINSSTVPRAGSPIANLHQTLDTLTRNGFSVCIVEEVKGPSDGKRRKERFVSGHAHPGNPYVYGLVEADFDMDFPDPVSIIGISRSASGYRLVSVMELMRSFSVEDQLTEEAVVAKLRAKPFQRLFLHKSLRDKSTETVRWGEFGEGGLLWAECRGQNFEWYNSDPVSELLAKVREIFDLSDDVEFRRVVPPPGERPRPLNVGTASQVGILPTQGVPSLLRALLPQNTHELCVAYLRDFLLNPPPYRVAACIQKAIRVMNDISDRIPEFECVSVAKLVKLIGAREANCLEFSRIKNMAEDLLLMEKDPQLSVLVGLLFDPTWLATGLHLERDQLLRDCSFLVKRLGEVLAPAGDPRNSISRSKFVPDEFFQDMEGRWKERVRRENVEKAYSDVEICAAALADAVEVDFHPIVLRTKGLATQVGGGRGRAFAEVSYSSQNQAVWLKGKKFRPTLWSGGPGEEEIKRLREAKDAKGKTVGDDWFTTDTVDNVLHNYSCAVDRASDAVIELLKSLSEELHCKMNTIVFLATFSIIAKTLFAHVREAKRRNWAVPEAWEQNVEAKARNGNFRMGKEGETYLHLEDLFPYWLDRSGDEVVLNTIRLESMFLLTGPNGGGKSSILRSICATTLLATCGLMVPARAAVVPKLDSIMLRMIIADSPADSKSSFQMEMSELRTIMTDATEKSLVLVDELCKGTEVSKGTFIVASVLEHLDHLGCLGVISTHLHGLLDLELDVHRVVRKAMSVHMTEDGRPKPTWRLVDGECRESLAFETARKEGVPESLVQRAEEFYRRWGKSLHIMRITDQDDTRCGGKPVRVDVSISSKENLQGKEDQAAETRRSPDSASDDSRIGTKLNIGGPIVVSMSRENLQTSREMENSRVNSQQTGWSVANGALIATERSSSRRQRVASQMVQSSSGKLVGALDDLKHVFLSICRRRLSDWYDVQLSGNEGHCECFVIGPRQMPPPVITNHSCVYVLKRPDGKFYVGETDNMFGRIESHRAAPGLDEAPFLFVPLPNKSVARAIETCLIKQLPSFGFVLVNKGDQNHKYFGTEGSLSESGEAPPF